jgi:hypothetical protein
MAAAAAGAQDVAPAPPPQASAPARAAALPKSTAQIDAGEPRAGLPMADTPPPPSAAVPNKPLARSAAAAAPKPRGAADRLDLTTATVTGDREQPKVMYIVPWKSSDIGDLSGKPMNSLLDEALAPVDRDEFKREVAYYDALKGSAPQNGASKAAAQGEK